MAYYIQLFSYKTYKSFCKSNKLITGFSKSQEKLCHNIKVGDKLICYMTKLSRWIGILEVTSLYFEDDMPIFEKPDPYIIRFNVKPLVFLTPEIYTIPIKDKICWEHLSFTKELNINNKSWTNKVRGSLRKLKKEDGQYLEKILIKQKKEIVEYKLTKNNEKIINAFNTNKIKNKKSIHLNKNENNTYNDKNVQQYIRESLKIQALLAKIGEKMNLKIWIPSNDRKKVLDIWKPKQKDNILEKLPFDYNNIDIQTIENIDVLWIDDDNFIVAAFEVEHTTSINSGMLKIADLMSLSPNLHIKKYIVAPKERKKKFFQELNRPIFKNTKKIKNINDELQTLSRSYFFISYDSIISLSREKNLKYLCYSVIDEYVESN